MVDFVNEFQQNQRFMPKGVCACVRVCVCVCVNGHPVNPKSWPSDLMEQMPEWPFYLLFLGEPTAYKCMVDFVSEFYNEFSLLLASA
jgi:hypothetical protein